MFIVLCDKVWLCKNRSLGVVMLLSFYCLNIKSHNVKVKGRNGLFIQSVLELQAHVRCSSNFGTLWRRLSSVAKTNYNNVSTLSSAGNVYIQ